MADEPTPPDSDETTRTVPSDFETPTRIGPYRLLQLLGEGGMGEVWEAEQTEPVRRRVALKLIKWGMDTKAVVARFEAERQALALMNHPNVAKVFDAGSTDQGRPYFVMELVQGESITKYCDRQRLTTRERLELLIQVCEGVQHAHQKAIIHRDIKPSNVLVQIEDGNPVLKIIDFGVAKATTQRLTERTVFTELGQIIGTPEYMSPEQAEMTAEDIDTRTDVYSLGVLAYELLVGALPFDSKELRQAGFDEIRRRIREQEPSKPSARVSTLGDASTASAKNRRSDPRSLSKQLRGDLDWITMKALEKDRTRRYGSPNELATDIRRHLSHEPVVASPPSTTYRARKFVRRHRIGATFATTVTVLLIGFGIGMSVLYSRAVTAEAESAKEAETARRVSDFLVRLFETSDPTLSGRDAADMTARELLDVGVARIRTELAESPVVRARLLHTMGKTHTSMWLTETAQQLLGESLALLDGDPNADPLLKADVLSDLADLLDSSDPDCVAMHRRALDLREEALGPDDPIVAGSLVSLAWHLKWESPDQAMQMVDRANAILERPRHPDLWQALNVRAVLVNNSGDSEGACRLWEQALAVAEEVLPPDNPETAQLIGNLSFSYRNLEDFETGLRMAERSLRLNEKIYGPAHPKVSDELNWVARLRTDLGDYTLAENLSERALEIMEAHYGAESPRVGFALLRRAEAAAACGDYEQARDLLERKATVVVASWGPEALQTVAARRQLGEVLTRTGDYQAARPHLEKALSIAEAELPESKWQARVRYGNALAALETEAGDLDRAAGLFERAVTTYDRNYPDSLSAVPGVWGLARVEERRGRLDESRKLYERALERLERAYGSEHPKLADVLNDYAGLLKRQGRLDEAERRYQRALAIREDRFGGNHRLVAESLDGYALLLRDTGRSDEARTLTTRAEQIRMKGGRGCDPEDEGQSPPSDSKTGFMSPP